MLVIVVMNTPLERILATMVCVVLAGACGGGGDSDPERRCGTPEGYPASLQRPAPRAQPLPCDAQPNYIGDVTLLHWPSDQLPMSPHLNNALFVYHEEFNPGLEGAAQRALSLISEWEGPLGINFFAETPNRHDDSAPMTISWPDETAGDAGGVARLTVNPETGEIQTAAIEIYATRSSLLGRVRATDVLMHEVGHALGIYGHSQHPGDLMQEGLRSCGESQARMMTEADVNTLASAYCGRAPDLTGIATVSWPERRERLLAAGAVVLADPGDSPDGTAVVEWRCDGMHSGAR